MADYKDAWTGTDAKWIDECAAPAGSAVITLLEDDWSEGVSATSLLGGQTQNSAGCFKYGNWASWAPYLLGVGQYVLDKMDVPMPDLSYPGNQHYTGKEYPLY